MNEIKSPIRAIHVSLNGGWKKKPKGFGKDSSVAFMNSAKFTGVIEKSFSDIESANDWIKENYPDFMNSTCGIGISLKLLDKELIDQLCNKKFYKIFRKNAKEWGKENKITNGSWFWQRYRGNNRYCDIGFSSKIRYKHLNFTNKEKIIVECRLFPTFQKMTLSQSAISFFYNLVSNYLGLRRLVL